MKIKNIKFLILSLVAFINVNTNAVIVSYRLLEKDGKKVILLGEVAMKIAKGQPGPRHGMGMKEFEDVIRFIKIATINNINIRTVLFENLQTATRDITIENMPYFYISRIIGAYQAFIVQHFPLVFADLRTGNTRNIYALYEIASQAIQKCEKDLNPNTVIQDGRMAITVSNHPKLLSSMRKNYKEIAQKRLREHSKAKASISKAIEDYKGICEHFEHIIKKIGFADEEILAKIEEYKKLFTSLSKIENDDYVEHFINLVRHKRVLVDGDVTNYNFSVIDWPYTLDEEVGELGLLLETLQVTNDGGHAIVISSVKEINYVATCLQNLGYTLVKEEGDTKLELHQYPTEDLDDANFETARKMSVVIRELLRNSFDELATMPYEEYKAAEKKIQVSKAMQGPAYLYPKFLEKKFAGENVDEDAELAAFTKTLKFKQICSNPGCENEGLNKCGRCRQAHYCSPQCQKEHWKTHKKECTHLPSSKASSKE